MENKYEEIRNGLNNYIFSCLQAIPFEGNKAKHVLSSILLEESLKISRDENNELNMYAVKPILKACIVILIERINSIKKLPSSEQIRIQINNYEEVNNFLNTLVSRIKE